LQPWPGWRISIHERVTMYDNLQNKFACPKCGNTVLLKNKMVCPKCGNTVVANDAKHEQVMRITEITEDDLVEDDAPEQYPVATRRREPVEYPVVRPAPRRQEVEEYRRRDRKDDLVDVGMTAPGGIGYKGKVTQKTADTMAITFLGGLMVALGVIVCMIFGIKPPAPPKA